MMPKHLTTPPHHFRTAPPTIDQQNSTPLTNPPKMQHFRDDPSLPLINDRVMLLTKAIPHKEQLPVLPNASDKTTRTHSHQSARERSNNGYRHNSTRQLMTINLTLPALSVPPHTTRHLYHLGRLPTDRLIN